MRRVRSFYSVFYLLIFLLLLGTAIVLSIVSLHKGFLRVKLLWLKCCLCNLSLFQLDLKTQELPLARIKKIMKLDEDVKMISAEAPVLFAKAAEIFIYELTLRAWVHTEDNKRRTLQVCFLFL